MEKDEGAVAISGLLAPGLKTNDSDVCMYIRMSACVHIYVQEHLNMALYP